MLQYRSRLGQQPFARIAIAAALAIASAALLWTHHYRVTQVAHRVEQEELLRWMDVIAPQVREWQSRLPPRRESLDGNSVVTTLSVSAQALELPLHRVDTAPDGSVTIGLDSARVDRLLPWLEELGTHHGLRIERITITRGSAPGLVNALLRVVEERGET